MANLRRITERVTAPFAGCRVDRTSGVIHGVKLCGLRSRNGRDYLPETFRRDHQKYEGVPINFNHGRDRLVEDVGGRIRNPHVDADGTPRGDAHLLKSHPMYERVMEAAERDPGLFGFSHVAHCRTGRSRDGREVVEGIESVECVDLVAHPATTTGLFEGKSMAITIEKIAEWVLGHPKASAKQKAGLRTLAEMDGMADVVTGLDPDAPGSEADPADGVKEAFKSAILHIVDRAMSGELDAKEALGKIKKLLACHGEVNGDIDTSDDTEEGLAILEALDACDKARFRPDRPDLDLIAATPADRRPAMIERLKRTTEGAGAEKPRSSGRSPGGLNATTPIPASRDDLPPDDPRTFAEWVRGD